MFAQILLLIIFLPSFVVFVFSVIQKNRIKVSKKISDKNFTVMIPNLVLIIGAMCALISLAVLLGFTYLPDERPNYIFYLVFGLLFWLGSYLIVKALTFKVMVKGKKIIVFSAFRKPYSFTFSEIISAVRQVKNNRIKSERIVVKTVTGKKLIVESGEISYKMFAEKVQSEVRKECLVGFE